MKHQQQQSITNLPLSPDEERRHRMIKYSVAMGIRVLCIIAIPFCPGLWWIIPAIGAVFLPYFAVVVANVSTDQRRDNVQRPGNILPLATPPLRPPGEPGDDTGAPTNGKDTRGADE